MIVIGEMRDMDTVQVALAAAMTGHLVITTVHTGDTVQAIERVVDLYPEEQRLQIASDLLIFQMHTDVFEFDSNHIIWQNEYVQANRCNSYCGVINIYNFLSDSFKFNRNADEGYLIGRIFINREKRFFVEGKRQTSMRPMAFGSAEITREALVKIIETAVYYAINFDLLMPPYEDNKRVTVDQFNTKMDNSKFTTGKRIGYEFNVDDI